MYHYQPPWFKKKQLFLPKNGTLKTFRLQMAGYDAGRKEMIYHSRLFPGSRNLLHQRWLMRSRKHPFQLFCQTMIWNTFRKRVNFNFFISTFQIKLTSWSQKSATGESLLAWQQQILWAATYPCSSLGRQRIHDASKMSSFHLVATETNEKVAWMENCLKSGSESWTGSLFLKEELLLLWQAVVQLILILTT